jgi:hypothetical protein
MLCFPVIHRFHILVLPSLCPPLAVLCQVNTLPPMLCGSMAILLNGLDFFRTYWDYMPMSELAGEIEACVLWCALLSGLLLWATTKLAEQILNSYPRFLAFSTSFHWLNISSFSVIKLVKNFHYFLHFFHWKHKWKTYDVFTTFPFLRWKFWNKPKSAAKVWSFSFTFWVKKSVKNNGHFSPIFPLKILKCSTSVWNSFAVLMPFFSLETCQKTLYQRSGSGIGATAVIMDCWLPKWWAKKFITHPVNLQTIIPLSNMSVQWKEAVSPEQKKLGQKLGH